LAVCEISRKKRKEKAENIPPPVGYLGENHPKRRIRAQNSYFEYHRRWDISVKKSHAWDR